MNKQAHHIVPRYRCKELGITTSYKVKINGKLVEFYFKENYLPDVEQIDHALIHWGYKCDDLEPLFEYVIPPQWIIDLIPRGDTRDGGAASLIALGEIDKIDMSGENHPRYTHGRSGTKEYHAEITNKSYWKDIEKNRKKHAVQARERYAKNKDKINRRRRELYAKKNTETQGEGTLDAHMG